MSIPHRKYLLVLSLVFALWWLYFADVQPEHEAEGEAPGFLRANSVIPWLYIHLPLSLSLISFGVAKKKLFEATAGGRLNPEYLSMFLAALALYFMLLGNPAFEPLVAVSSLVGFAGVLLFAFLVFSSTRETASRSAAART